MPDVRDLLPLKPLVFEVLLALGEGDRHGWSLVREIQQKTDGQRILPANFYRTLRTMLADGLIEEVQSPADGEARERRYFRLTRKGEEAAGLEARRLRDVVADARTRRLLKKTSGVFSSRDK
jgi:DNA-binding PadR family transcriptional regulator